jgi:hypothetical protein
MTPTILIIEDNTPHFELVRDLLIRAGGKAF